MGRAADIVPISLVIELRDKIDSLYSKDRAQGFIFYLNQNIEILKRNGIVNKDVTRIVDNVPHGVMEKGEFSKSNIDRVIERKVPRGNKKLIIAMIMALWGEEWKLIFLKYYSPDDKILSEIRLNIIDNQANTNIPDTVPTEVIKHLTLDDWVVSTTKRAGNCDYRIVLPTESGYVKKISCQLKIKSQVFRFAIKLVSKGKYINREFVSIDHPKRYFAFILERTNQSNNILIQDIYSKWCNEKERSSNELMVNNIIPLEISIDDDNMLIVRVNEIEFIKYQIPKKIAKFAYMVVSSEKEKIRLVVKNINYEICF